MAENATLRLLFNRRSVRKFRPDDISPEVWSAILEAGRFAPSTVNLQTWSFGVYDAAGWREIGINSHGFKLLCLPPEPPKLTRLPFASFTHAGRSELYAAGYIDGDETFAFGNGMLLKGSSKESSEIMVKYNAAGKAQWARSFVAGGADSMDMSIVVDSGGNTNTTGETSRTDTFDFGNGVVVVGTSEKRHPLGRIWSQRDSFVGAKQNQLAGRPVVT